MNKVSVIITMYNTSRYAAQCIESVLELERISNVEVIVINDGSTDDTESIIKRYLGNGKIKYISQENSGVSIARNRGIQEATGEYIMFVDGDDWVDNSIIYELSDALSDSVDIVSCCCMINEEDRYFPEFFFEENFAGVDEITKLPFFKQLLDPGYGQKMKTVYAAIGVPWGKLYRSDFIKQNHLAFNPSLRRMQDNIFNMYAFQNAKGIKYINKPLYNYRAEHISGYKKPYSSDNLYSVYIERQRFMENNCILRFSDLSEMYYSEIVHLHIEADKYEILTYNRKQAVQKMHVNNQRFSSIIDRSYWEKDKVTKVFKWCIDKNYYSLLYYIYKTYCKYIRK